MLIPGIKQIVAECAISEDAQLLIKRGLELAQRLSLPIHLHAFLASAQTENGAEDLKKYLDQLSKAHNLLEAAIQKARKSTIRCEAAVRTNAHELLDEPVLRILGPGRHRHVVPDELNLLVFETSRSRNQLERPVIVAESELLERQKVNFFQWFNLTSDEQEPKVVIIQGDSNLQQWESFLTKSSFKQLTIDMLDKKEDLPTYIRKTKARVICLPNRKTLSIDRILAFHKLNRADILLF